MGHSEVIKTLNRFIFVSDPINQLNTLALGLAGGRNFEIDLSSWLSLGEVERKSKNIGFFEDENFIESRKPARAIIMPGKGESTFVVNEIKG